MLFDFLLEKFTEESYPEVNIKKCIYSNKATKSCSKCIDICPENAITFKNKKVHFDKELCSRCGICKVVCPTQGINMNGLGEENILRTIKNKKSIIFSCYTESPIDSLKITCLNALHPELLCALFILYSKNTFYFNISRCKNCKIVNNDDLLIFSTLSKVENFLKPLGIKPNYKIIKEESEFKNLPQSIISRRDLFSLIKKESTNVATQATETIFMDKDNYLSIRKVLLNAIDSSKNLIENNIIVSTTFFNILTVNTNCNGCGICEHNCSERAWKIQNKNKKLSIYHNSGKCYKCNKCIDLCPKNAIEEGSLGVYEINSYNFKKEIDLSTCVSCKKEFIPSYKDQKQCTVCKNREDLRKKISTI